MSNLLETCRDLPERHFGAGEVVIEQGRPQHAVLLLVTGELVIERDGVPFARIDSPGAFFGEMSVLLGSPATATVRAAVDTTFLVADDGEAFLASRPDLSLTIARTLAIRLDNLSGYLADVKRQFADQADHLGMLDTVIGALIHHQAPSVKPGSARMPDYDY